MAEDATEFKRPLGLILAGGYAAFLAVAILFGVLGSIGSYLEVPHNAVSMPVVSTLIALVLGGTGFGLLRRSKHSNLARFAFFTVAPWGALALGSAFAHTFWQDDIPYTHFLFIVYAPLAFLLSRVSVLDAVGAKDHTWLRRGGGLLLACALLMLAARFGVMSTKPHGGGGGFYGTLVSMNDYVKRLVITVVPFWHYVAGFVAVSIPVARPVFLKRGEAAAGEQGIVLSDVADAPSDERDAA
ncbi:MAG: hypothetical protein H6858_08385, partial [Rhodospirillales bacterium]|nr:hypothetical protein [Rhodospirillales bacterium]